MESDWSPDYRTWMRERFPRLNQSLDDALTVEALTRYAEEVLPVAKAISAGKESIRERFTYISMMHSAAYHHKKRGLEAGLSIPLAFEDLLEWIERSMIAMAQEIGVEHRFLSAFYLFYNPEVPELNGRFAQFRANAYETAFICINREGTLQYKAGAEALSKSFDLLQEPLPSVVSLRSHLTEAANAFRKISLGNAMLLKTPGGEEFHYLTQYFGEVRVAGGLPLRGVNAGDQPWSYIIDLLLGVNLKHVFEQAFEGTAVERQYPSTVRTSSDLIRYEFETQGYLHRNYLLPEDYAALDRVMDTLNHSGDTLSALMEKLPQEERYEAVPILYDAVKYYLAASNVHYQLARRYVPKSANGEQIGSAGTNIVKFLRDGLNAAREAVKDQLESHYPELHKAQPTETTIA